jgi:hypothetical protein
MEVIAIHLAKKYEIPLDSKIIITGGTPVGAGRTNFMKVVTYGNKEINIDL